MDDDRLNESIRQWADSADPVTAFELGPRVRAGHRAPHVKRLLVAAVGLAAVSAGIWQLDPLQRAGDGQIVTVQDPPSPVSGPPVPTTSPPLWNENDCPNHAELQAAVDRLRPGSWIKAEPKPFYKVDASDGPDKCRIMLVVTRLLAEEETTEIRRLGGDVVDIIYIRDCDSDFCS